MAVDVLVLIAVALPAEVAAVAPLSIGTATILRGAEGVRAYIPLSKTSKID